MPGVLLKACLNGARSPREHPALPVTAAQLAADAAACVAAGAGAIHLHPRGGDGRESLEAAVIDPVVARVRAACRVPVGVATGAWVEPDPERRAALVAAWREPDFASVNLSEEGAPGVMRALLAAGIGVEAGVWSPEDAERLAATGPADRLTRVLVEVMEGGVAEAQAIEVALDELGIRGPRVLHGEEAACWPVLAYARSTGRDTRIGLEDTLALPDGTPAPSNEALVRAALALG
ncbi:MAG TPA: 3-keto-5-aminohexanoate cleavage protein [Solirubrobacteraceae bacterium]|nr:3-keto-5-aminohexanoate cleavage protein [Solirubrobacteraceae bacterium]